MRKTRLTKSTEIDACPVIGHEIHGEEAGEHACRLEREHERAEGKLNNESFVAKAPAEIVDKERQRVATLGQDMTKLREQLAKLESLV